MLIVFGLTLFMACEKETLEDPATANLQLETSNRSLSCTLLNSNPIRGNVTTFSTYEGINTGFSCDSGTTDPPCFARKLALATETEIFNQSGLQGTFNPTITIVEEGPSFTVELNELMDVSDIYPTMDEARANIAYRALTCELFDVLDDLPSLPAGQGYGIKFDILDVTPVEIGGTGVFIWTIIPQYQIVIYS